MKKFIRQDSARYSKIGKSRKKLQRWRRPKGRDSKMRLSMAGHPKTVSIGYRSSAKESRRIRGLIPVMVHNASDLRKIGKEEMAVISGRLGAKKKIEVIKKAEEMKIKIFNVNKSKPMEATK